MNIVFLGNCQMATLNQIYAIFVAPETGDITRFVGAAAELDEADAHAIEAADLLVQQVADFEPKTDLSRLAVKAERHLVPVAGAGFIWPFAGTRHPDSIRLHGDYDPFREEMGDSWLNKALHARVPAKEAARRYLQTDIAREVALDRRYELMMDRQHARERATEYQIARIIEQHFRDEQLFLTPFHPTLRISRYMALTFLAAVGAPSGAVERVRRLMTDSFYFKFALPVHPRVAAHFGLKWADERTLYRFHEDGYVTFSEFVDRYLLCRANSPLYEAMIALERGEPDAAERIEKALSATPSSPWGLNALAKARLLQGRHEAALPLLRRALEIDPELEWGHFHLAQALRELGDSDGAEAAFRAEIRLRPFSHGIYHALAHFLFHRGNIEGAVDMTRRALELVPKSAAYHQFLTRLNELRMARLDLD